MVHLLFFKLLPEMFSQPVLVKLFIVVLVGQVQKLLQTDNSYNAVTWTGIWTWKKLRASLLGLKSSKRVKIDSLKQSSKKIANQPTKIEYVHKWGGEGGGGASKIVKRTEILLWNLNCVLITACEMLLNLVWNCLLEHSLLHCKGKYVISHSYTSPIQCFLLLHCDCQNKANLTESRKLIDESHIAVTEHIL